MMLELPRKLITSSAICALLVGSTSLAFAGAQSMKPRMVQRERYNIIDPLRIVRVTYMGTDIHAKVNIQRDDSKSWFQADDDWLKYLAVVVKNTTNHTTIVALTFDIDFPESGTGTPDQPWAVRWIHLGQLPEHALYNTRSGGRMTQPSDTTLSLAPGQELTVDLLPYFDSIKEAIEGNKTPKPLSAITTCFVRLGFVYLENGDRWHPGLFERPDPNVLGKYIPLTMDELRDRAKQYRDQHQE